MAAKILVCDDETHIVRAVEFKLRRAGLEVMTASDGAEAWQRIQQEPPQLVISDCQMPRMNGLELIEHIRRWEPTAQIPVIMLTGKGYELPEEKLQELRVSALFAKPFSPRELEAQVRQLLAQAETAASA